MKVNPNIGQSKLPLTSGYMPSLSICLAAAIVLSLAPPAIPPAGAVTGNKVRVLKIAKHDDSGQNSSIKPDAP